MADKLPTYDHEDDDKYNPKPTVVKQKKGVVASTEKTTTARRDEIQAIVANTIYWNRYPRVMTDEDCADRLNEFFGKCAETGEIPTYEKMCLAMGYTRSTVTRWERGYAGTVRAELIQRAKDVLAAIDAELVSNNKIPQVTYIFRSKNFYGLTDKNDDTPIVANELDADTDTQTLAKKYALNVPFEDKDKQ